MYKTMNNSAARGTALSGRLVACVVAALFSATLHAQSNGVEENAGLKLPADLKVKQQGNIEIEERRIGSRLDQLTVRHKNGLTEIYDNDNPGDLWGHAENDLGDVPNLRKWTIGSW